MTTLDLKIEMTQALHSFCQTFRRQKRRPEIAAAASEREMQFRRELEELEQERARLQCNSSGDGHNHHDKAA